MTAYLALLVVFYAGKVARESADILTYLDTTALLYHVLLYAHSTLNLNCWDFG